MSANQLALISAAGLLAYGAWRMNRPSEPASVAQVNSLWANSDEMLTGATQSTAEFIDTITGGGMRLSNMARVSDADLRNANVQALLQVIRKGEGTTGPHGYRTLFGGGLFTSMGDHPRQKITRTMGGRKLTSTAAGAYQFLSSSWDETARIMGLSDFTPASQDRAAVGRIAARGALADTRAGRFDVAIKKIASEWASMPGSAYGQPVISLALAREVFASAGGTLNQA